MKYLKVTPEMVKKTFEEAYELAVKTKVTPNSISLANLNTSVVLKDEEKAVVRLEVEARKKLLALVDRCDKEIGWHGVIERDTENPKLFIIKDIVVFPQEVTGATVDPDAEAYTKWLYNMDGEGVTEEQFEHLRYHGHSHVNMATFPSGTDTTFQKNIMENCEDFYVFSIHNKSGSIWANIYDVENNVIYENNDIIWEGCIDEAQAWASEQIKKKVTTKTYTQPKTTTNAYAGTVGNYGGCYGRYSGYYDDDDYAYPAAKTSGNYSKKTESKPKETEKAATTVTTGSEKTEKAYDEYVKEISWEDELDGYLDQAAGIE